MKASKPRGNLWTKDEEERLRQLFLQHALPAELKRRLTLDPHSPAEFRCNGVARNLPEFHAAFGVKEGDKLWLPADQRVRIW